MTDLPVEPHVWRGPWLQWMRPEAKPSEQLTPASERAIQARGHALQSCGDALRACEDAPLSDEGAVQKGQQAMQAAAELFWTTAAATYLSLLAEEARDREAAEARLRL